MQIDSLSSGQDVWCPCAKRDGVGEELEVIHTLNEWKMKHLRMENKMRMTNVPSGTHPIPPHAMAIRIYHGMGVWSQQSRVACWWALVGRRDTTGPGGAPAHRVRVAGGRGGCVDGSRKKPGRNIVQGGTRLAWQALTTPWIERVITLYANSRV